MQKQLSEQEVKTKAFFLMARLKAAGHERVEIEFDGSGDSGSIESVYIDDKPNMEFEEELQDWAYELLDVTGVDWYNNAGGFGTITWDVPERTYKLVIDQRIEDSEEVVNATVQFGDWKPKPEETEDGVPELL